MKKNLRFKQLRLNNLNKQKNKKKDLRLVLNSIRLSVVSRALKQLTFVLLVSF